MKKKAVVITGAGSGLGREAVKVIPIKDYSLFGKDLKLGNFSLFSEGINVFPPQFEMSFPLDSWSDINLENDRNKLKELDFDVLINNAAIGDSGSIADISVDRIENVFETNVFSNIKITQVALKNMIENKRGRVIFLSSLAGRISIPFLGPYCASKFAIEGFASSLRKEMKKLDDVNIQIGIIEPGAYATGFNKENNEKKYEWMYKDSYFKYKWKDIKEKETKYWNFIEKKNFNSIIKQYIHSVEDRKLKFRYTAPRTQSFIIQLQRIFGL